MPPIIDLRRFGATATTDDEIVDFPNGGLQQGNPNNMGYTMTEFEPTHGRYRRGGRTSPPEGFTPRIPYYDKSGNTSINGIGSLQAEHKDPAFTDNSFVVYKIQLPKGNDIKYNTKPQTQTAHNDLTSAHAHKEYSPLAKPSRVVRHVRSVSDAGAAAKRAMLLKALSDVFGIKKSSKPI